MTIKAVAEAEAQAPSNGKPVDSGGMIKYDNVAEDDQSGSSRIPYPYT